MNRASQVLSEKFSNRMQQLEEENDVEMVQLPDNELLRLVQSLSQKDEGLTPTEAADIKKCVSELPEPHKVELFCQAFGLCISSGWAELSKVLATFDDVLDPLLLKKKYLEHMGPSEVECACEVAEFLINQGLMLVPNPEEEEQRRNEEHRKRASLALSGEAWKQESEEPEKDFNTVGNINGQQWLYTGAEIIYGILRGSGPSALRSNRDVLNAAIGASIKHDLFELLASAAWPCNGKGGHWGTGKDTNTVIFCKRKVANPVHLSIYAFCQYPEGMTEFAKCKSVPAMMAILRCDKSSFGHLEEMGTANIAHKPYIFALGQIKRLIDSDRHSTQWKDVNDANPSYPSPAGNTKTDLDDVVDAADADDSEPSWTNIIKTQMAQKEKGRANVFSGAAEAGGPNDGLSMQELYNVLLDRLQNRQLHLPIVAVLGEVVMPRMKHIHMNQLLQVLEKGGFTSKIRKLESLRLPMQCLAKIQQPILSIQEIGHMFGHVSDMLLRTKRLIVHLNNFIRAHDENEKGNKKPDMDQIDKHNILMFEVIPQFLTGCTNYFKGLCEEGTFNGKSNINVTVEALQHAITKRKFFIYLRHMFESRKKGNIKKYRHTIWELLMAPVIFFPILRMTCDLAEGQCRFPELPPDKLAALQDLFDSYDRNSNGKLEKEEVKQVISGGGHHKTSLLWKPFSTAEEKNFARNFDVVDLDRSGTISHKEFLFLVIPRLVTETLNDKHTDSLEYWGEEGTTFEEQASENPATIAELASETRAKEKAQRQSRSGSPDGKPALQLAQAQALNLDVSSENVASTLKKTMVAGEQEAQRVLNQYDQMHAAGEENLVGKVTLDRQQSSLGTQAKRVGQRILGRHVSSGDTKRTHRELLSQIVTDCFKAHLLADVLWRVHEKKQPLGWVYKKLYTVDEENSTALHRTYKGTFEYEYTPPRQELVVWMDANPCMGSLLAILMGGITTVCFFWRADDMFYQLRHRNNVELIKASMSKENVLSTRMLGDRKNTRANSDANELANRLAGGEKTVTQEAKTVSANVHSFSPSKQGAVEGIADTDADAGAGGAGLTVGEKRAQETTWRAIIYFNFNHGGNDLFNLFGRKALANVWPGDQAVAWVVGLLFSAILFASPFLFTFIVVKDRYLSEESQRIIAGTALVAYVVTVFVIVAYALRALNMTKKTTDLGRNDRRTVDSVHWFPIHQYSSNWFEVLCCMIEFAQHSSFSFSEEIPWPKGLRGLFSLSILNFSTFSATTARINLPLATLISLLLFIVIWVTSQLYFEVSVVASGAAMQRSTATADKSKKEKTPFGIADRFARYVLPFLTGTLFMVIMSNAFAVFDCSGYSGKCMLCGADTNSSELVVLCSLGKREELWIPKILQSFSEEGISDPLVLEYATTASGVQRPMEVNQASSQCVSTDGLYQSHADLCKPDGCFHESAPRCYTGSTLDPLSHSTATFLALLLFGMYFPSATLTPFQVYFVDPFKEFRYAPLYVMELQFLKCMLCALGTLLTQTWWLYLSFSIAVNGLLAWANWFRGTCNIGWMNHWKAVYFAMAAWSGVCALFARGAWNDDTHWLPAACLFLGWWFIGCGGQLHWTFYGKEWMANNVDEEFADLHDDDEIKLIDQARMPKQRASAHAKQEELRLDVGSSIAEEPQGEDEFRLRAKSTSKGDHYI